jgi:hypothetical protein
VTGVNLEALQCPITLVLMTDPVMEQILCAQMVYIMSFACMSFVSYV